MCSTPRPLKFLLMACAVVLLAALNVQANSMSFSFTSGALGTSTYQNVQGTIASGNGTITITLDNVLTNAQVISIAQNVSGFYFTASTNGTPPGTATLFSSGAGFAMDLVNGQPANVIANYSPTGWVLVNSGGGNLGICVICAGTNAPVGPGNTIIGGDGSNSYLKANGSLNGNQPHNPFLGGTAAFTLNVAGVTPNTTFSNIGVQFGTQQPSTPVPEAGSLITLFLSGLTMASGFVLRHRPPSGAN